MINAAQAKSTDKAFNKGSGARRPSLFSLATGGGRRAAKEAAKEAAAAEVPVEAKPQAESHQPELGAMNPADRLTPSQTEEDLLDIPAFLRRQAN